jgi:hypothetical protein
VHRISDPLGLISTTVDEIAAKKVAQDIIFNELVAR